MVPTPLDALLMMSPTKSGKVRVSSTRYRNDPYRARVNPLLKPTSPLFVPKLKGTVGPLAAKPVALGIPRNYPHTFAAAATAATPASTPKAVLRADAFTPSAPAAPAPKASTLEHFALVGFKHETAMYRAPFRVAVGDVVIVEADRGEHIGVVQSITTARPSYNVPSNILRHASAMETCVIDELTMKEKRVTAQVQKLAESFGLGIRVNDTEFQMDGNKLTVFFSSRVFVDFRKLQRSLFREYRCRIWLVNWAEVRPYDPVPVNAVC